MDEDIQKRLEKISEAFTTLLNTLNGVWLPGRTMAIAQTKLEEAHMWLMQMPNDPTIKQIQQQQSPIIRPKGPAVELALK